MQREHKKGNLFLLILKIVFLFLVTDFVISNVPALMTRAVNTGKFGLSFIVEMFAVLVVFIVMLMSKNQYVFTEKKEGFFKSIFLGLPLLIIAVFVGLVNIPSLFEPSFNLSNFLTLAMFCVSIGLYEEFLCRGWLLNEFLEQYGRTRKQVITSIFISALIFGLMHISNIWVGGQSVSTTIIQIIQATAIGMLFGAVYYRTKNIWSVVFLHGFYDFCVFLSSVNTLKDCHAVTESITITQIMATGMLVGIYLITTFIILRKSKTNHLIPDEKAITPEEKNKSEDFKKIALVVIFCLIFCPMPMTEEEEEMICYDYKEKELKGTEFHYPSYATYQLTEEELVKEVVTTVDPIDPTIVTTTEVETRKEHTIKFSAEDKKLTIDLDGNKANIKFDHPIKMILLEQKDNYLLVIHEQNQTSGESKIHYSNYIKKGEVKNTKKYLEELSKSLEKELVPDVNSIGYITTRDSDYKYPILYVGTSNYLFLDENNELFILKN